MTGSANPFVGPRPFKAGERLWGRAREVRELDDVLSAERVVLLCSPSGAGKSSLVEAALLPRLEGSFEIWGPTRVHRDEVAAGRGNRYVESALAGFEETVPERLRHPPGELAGLTLRQWFKTRPRRRSAPPHALLVFDQLEEVLTVEPLAENERRELFGQLGELLRDPGIWALLVLREDYLVAFDPYAELVPTHLKNRYRIDLLGLEAAREAMVSPAREGGREFPAAERLARDLATMKVQQADGSFVEGTGRHVEPVQLQVVCRRLWDALPADARSIDAAHLERFGDVSEALGGFYGDSLARIAGGDKALERSIRDWFAERLVTPGGIRGQVPGGAGASDGLANELVARLLDTHLVRAEQRAGATWYELAHDRLIQPVRENNLAWRAEHLSEAQERAALWEREGRPPGLLLAGADLAEAEAAASTPTAVERDFLAASRRARDAADRERRTAWLVRFLAVAASVVGVVALFQWRAAERQRAAAENLARASVAAHLLDQGETAAGNLLALEVRRPGATPTAVAALHRALARPVEETVLAGHADEVKAAAWSPGGDRVLTASWDDTARVWDAAIGETLAVLEGHTGHLTAAAWSPDGRRAATASWDATARIWDAGDGAELHVLAGHGDVVKALAWDPDGRRLATFSRDGSVRAWDADTGEARGVLLPADAVPDLSPMEEYLEVAWSGDGRRLAANLGARVFAWDVESGEATIFAGHGDVVLALAWSPDGRRLATASADGTARIWDAATGAAGAVLEGHTDWVADVAWSPDGRVATASLDATARIWDAATGETAAILRGHEQLLWSVAWSPDGRWLATASEDTTVRVWAPRGGAATAVLAGHRGQVRAAAWDPAGRRLLSSSSDGTARTWQPLSIGEDVAVLRGHADEVYAAAWSPDGERAVTASWDHTARVWNVAAGTETALLAGHAEGVTTAAWSPDGRRVATASWDRTARIWDAATGDELAVLAGHTREVWDVEWSPDGSRVATASWDYSARIWDPANGESLFDLPHREKVLTVAWSPDSTRVVTASVDRTARIWDAGTGGELAQLEGHEDFVVAASWSPDGSRVLTISYDGTGRIWDAQTATTTAVLREIGKDVRAAAWSPDGGRVLVASWDPVAGIWDARTGDRVAVLEGHTDALECVAWSPDGRHVATGGHDRTVRLWQADSGAAVAALEGHRGVVYSLAWSAAGGRLLTASGDGTVRVWAVSESYPDYLRGRIRGRLSRCLDAEVYGRLLGASGSEARRRRGACEACVPRFFERLGDAPPWRWREYEAAWRTYEGCFSDRLANP